MSVTPPTALAPDPPLHAAAVRLQKELDIRWAARRSADGRPPAVVTVGAVDITQIPDPARRRANVHLTSGSVLLGPWGGAVGQPEACGQCLDIRWQRLRGRTERDALEDGSELRAVGCWPDLPSFVVDAVWHVFCALVDAPPAAGGFLDPDSAALPRVTVVELAGLRSYTAPLLPEPNCPNCAETRPDRPMPFEAPQSRPMPAPESYRLHGVRDYRLPIGALTNPVSGAIGAGTLMNAMLPTTAPVTGSIFNRSYAGLIDVSWSGHANSFADSRRLAYLEGLERYAGTHRRSAAATVIAAYADVADRALDPLRCGQYPEDTYDLDPMVRRFDPQQPIPWVWGHVIDSGAPILVPRRICFYSSCATGDNFILSSSSGCATGGCLEEAILYGLLELIERDAFLVGWYARHHLRGIDLDSCDSPAVRSMVDRATLCGYRVLAFDNRIDLPTPVVTTVAVRDDGGPGLLSFAAAAHMSPERAVAAALSETLTYIPLQRGTTKRRWDELEAMADDYSLVHTVNDHAALFGLPRMREHAEEYLAKRPLESMADLYGEPRPPAQDLRHHLQGVLDQLIGRGYDVIVVDQTTPEQFGMGLRSVCTIVPGLLPIDFGWLRQRALTMPRLHQRLRDHGVGPRMVPHPFP